VGGAHKR